MPQKKIYKIFVYVNSLVERILYPLLVVVLFVWIIISNLAVIIVLLKYPVTTASNAVARVSLAVADIIVGLVVCCVICYIFISSSFQLDICGIMTGIGSATGGTSIIIATALAVERYYFFVKPLRYGIVLKPKCLMFSMISIYIALVIYFTVLGQIVGYQLGNSELYCKTIDQSTLHETIRYFILYIFPFLLITIIVIKTKKLQSTLIAPENNPLRAKLSKEIKLIVLLSGGSVLCAIPSVLAVVTFNAIYPVGYTGKSTILMTLMRLLVYLAAIGSSVMNSLVQFLLDKDVYVGLLKIMGRTAYFSWQVEMLEIMKKNKSEP